MRFPEIERHRVRLRLTRPARFHFLHGGALRGLLSAALRRHRLPSGVIPADCERGRVLYRPGDPYQLGLTLVDDGRGVLEELVAGLRRVGAEGTPGNGPLPRLAGNFEVEAVEEIEVRPPHERASELANESSPLVLRLLSPLRVERPASMKVRGAGYLNEDCFPIGHFLERLWKRSFLLSRRRYPTARERDRLRPALSPPAGVGRNGRRGEESVGARARPGHLLWLDLPVKGDPEKRRPYTLGGVVGRVVLDGVPEEWLPHLALGELVHAGGSIHFGLGRYRIEREGDGGVSGREPFRPARWLLERAAEPESLERALDHVTAESEAPGVDGVFPQAVEAEADPLVAELSERLRRGEHRPSPLLGLVIRKDDGGARALAIPTVRDRIAQRAAMEVLSPAVDTLLEDASYAYRKGFSRAGAARAIQRAYDAGYRYVLDADITAFFDSVDQKLLAEKLEALYPDEPLTELIRAWVRAPVELAGRTIRRDRGLPQGSPIAPLLANLYLDEFDEEILGEGFRLVRYADDFVVLTRDLEEAGRALQAATEALAELHLRINPDETAIRSIDDGFTYLGYLFCRSLVLEAEGEEEDGEAERELEPEDVPEHSWLARVPFAEVRELVRPGRTEGDGRTDGREGPGSDGPRRVEAVPLASGPAVAQPVKRPVYVTSHDAELRLERGTLAVERAGRTIERVAIRTLSHAVFVGRSRATVPLLLELSRHGVPVFFCRRSGQLYATLEPQGAEGEADWGLWLHQARAAEGTAERIDFAREVVAARLHNCATLAVRFGWEGSREAAEEIRGLLAAVGEETTRSGLLGLEGRGAERFLRALAETLRERPGEDWGFRGREKRPPPDPMNAMLSFGYTLLHNHVSTALVAAGLNPRIGLYHRGRGRHHALASDVVEEFRHLAEATAWSFVSRGRAKPEDFSASPDGRWPCLMDEELRKRFIGALEGRLATVFTPAGEEAMTYRAYMARQARRVARLVKGEVARYSGLRLHG